MAVNSIVPMMTPAHLRAPQKSPVTLQLIKEATKPTPVTVPLLKPRNGVGHFVLPLQRILFTYCSHCGDSTSTRYTFGFHRYKLTCLKGVLEEGVCEAGRGQSVRGVCRRGPLEQTAHHLRRIPYRQSYNLILIV